MKRIYLSIAVAVSLFFSACEKEEMSYNTQQPEQTGNGGYIINPEDTAGIVVPEGYALVVFTGNKAQTRASLDPIPDNSNNTRIKHLQYLIYRKSQDNMYILERQVTVAAPERWPAKAVTAVLPATGTYKVVFLGNVDNSLFSGETVLEGVTVGSSTYTDARIKLPSLDGFGSKEDKLFHWFRSGDIEITQSTGTILQPVTLQRIVTKSSLTTYGIPSDITVTGNDYPSRFYASLLDPNHELGLYDKVFGTGSQFEEALKELLERDIIFPVASCLADKSMLDKSKTYASWYNGLDKEDYLLNYVAATEGGRSGYTHYAYASKPNAENALTRLKETINLTDDNKAAINDFLEGLYTGTYSQGMMEGIIEDNFRGDDGKESFTAAKEAAIAALQEGQEKDNAVFPVWSNLTSVPVLLSGSYPSAVDFDLNVIGEDLTFTQSKDIDLTSSSSSSNADKSLNIYLLGSMDTGKSYTFGMESLGTFTTDGISGQILKPNTCTNYRLVPSDISLGTEVSADAGHKVIVSYYHLWKQINNQVIKLQAIKWPLTFSNNLGDKTHWYSDYNYWNIENENKDSRLSGTLLTSYAGNDQDKVYMLFKIPDFSPENLTGSLKWESETKTE